MIQLEKQVGNQSQADQALDDVLHVVAAGRVADTAGGRIHIAAGAAQELHWDIDVPPRAVVMGVPARVVRELTPEQIEGLRRSAAHYVENAQRYRQGLKKIG